MDSSKILLQRILLLVIITGSTLFLVFTIIYFALQLSPSMTTIAPVATPPVNIQKEVSVGLPIRLVIPKIGIDTNLEYVGLTPGGELDVSKNPANAAWYNLGPRPGEKGNAIIDGHYGWVNNTPAIFDTLHTLKKGDVIYIEDSQKRIITFIVYELKSYDKNKDYLDVFVSDDDRAHLNLITCQGVWNKVGQNYSDRLVVFANEEIKL